MKSLHTRAVVYGLVIVLGLLSALPNLLSPTLSGMLPDWYQQNTVSLGLDLQGGSHLLLEADIQELFTSEHEAIAGELTISLRETDIRYGRLQITDRGIELPVRQPEWVSEAASLARDRKSTRLNSSHVRISYAVFCLKKKKTTETQLPRPGMTDWT